MVEFCEACGKKTETVIVKNKRGRINVYCLACGSFKRSANKLDKAHLNAMQEAVNEIKILLSEMVQETIPAVLQELLLLLPLEKTMQGGI